MPVYIFVCMNEQKASERRQEERKETERKPGSFKTDLIQCNTITLLWQILYRRCDQQEGEIYLELVSRRRTCTLA